MKRPKIHPTGTAFPFILAVAGAYGCGAATAFMYAGDGLTWPLYVFTLVTAGLVWAAGDMLTDL